MALMSVDSIMYVPVFLKLHEFLTHVNLLLGSDLCFYHT
jgi:hypothetical protein